MQKEIVCFGKRIQITQSYIQLLLTVFILSLLSKGAVLFRGFAVDDYPFSTGVGSEAFSFVSQGRYIAATIAWLVDSYGVNINDMYFPLGLIALLLYSAFVVSILRFVGIDTSPSAGLVGGIIIAHPYLTEIFTFRMSLIFLCTGLIFCILALEILKQKIFKCYSNAIALFATLSMLLIYQIFINYFAVTIVFTFIFSQIQKSMNDQASNVYRDRAISLMFISIIGIILSTSMFKLSVILHFTAAEGRTNFIALEKVPERLFQILSALKSIYWSPQPIFSGWLKKLVLALVIASIVILLKYSLIIKKEKTKSITHFIYTLCAIVLLIPLSLGAIIPLDNWWPVPRVVSHVSIITGLIFLISDHCIQNSNNFILESFTYYSRIVALIGFVFLSNQILADQQRLNQWDKMKANRIISRLEAQPNFGNIKFIHVNGGSWVYPYMLRTVLGDMNISALSVPYSKVALLSEVSGYNFKRAVGDKATAGESYCTTKKSWPSADSIIIDNDLAIICL